jgi:cytochrome c-type biogenesis protein CcmH
VPQVIVGARISKSGNAIAQPGDLQVLSSPVAVGTGGLKLEISEVVR